MKLTVSKENIEQAEKPFCRYCPAENALISAGYSNVSVATHSAKGNKNGIEYRFQLGIELVNAIAAYDSGFIFPAGEYEITEK